jgi:hypothetical protein
MLSSQIDQAERRAVLRNDAKVQEQQREQEERRGTFAPDQSLPREGSTFHQFAQADANIDRGRFTAHERSTVVGATPGPVYPAGPAWCADPGSQLLEPPLGLDNPELEPSSLLAPAVAQATPNPASGEVAPSIPLDVERRGAGLGLSQTTGDPVGVSFSQPSRAFNLERDTGSPPLRRRRL